MSIIRLLEKVFAFLVEAFSLYSKQIDIDNGRRIEREVTSAELKKREDEAKVIHSTSLDDLVSMRTKRKTGTRQQVRDDIRK